MATFNGSDRADVLIGTLAADEILGAAGDDILIGLDGADTINGGGDDDVLDGGEDDDVLIGGGGNDIIVATHGDDNVDGGTGDDLFVVHGRRGDQVVVSDTGGIDTLDFSRAQKGGSIDLRSGATSTVDGRKVTISGEKDVALPLDFVLSQDLSGSFGDDVATVQALAPKLFAAVKKLQPDALFGVTSFIDKPTFPFGGSTDYEYRTNQPLSGSRNDFLDAIDGLTLGGGSDVPESQLTALLQLSLRTEEIGYRSDSLKIVVLTTDAEYHQAGDFGTAPPNNGDDVLDGTPPGTGEDYPTVAQVKDALQGTGIVPIFAVTAGAMSYYETLVDLLGFGVVVELSSDSSDIIAAIREGITTVSAAVIENAIGTRFRDKIRGNDADNDLDGRGGNDRIWGGKGDDDLDGGAGKDKLHGEAGEDVIVGGAGNDILSGGDDADTFAFAAGDGNDRINDFDLEEGDLIDLSSLEMGFEDLSIGTKGGDAVVAYGDGSVRLVGIAAGDVTADFFLF